MIHSSGLSQNPLLSPLLKQTDLSPHLSPFPTHSRRLSEDLADLIGFNLEQAPIQSSSIQPPEQKISQIEINQLFQPQRKSLIELQPQQVQISSINVPKEEFHSPKPQEISEDSSMPLLQIPIEAEDFARIQSIINYLIAHCKLPEERISIDAIRLFQDDPRLKEVFQILAHKFKKLRKTKEEMVKYCIRKAFKFVTDSNKKSSKARDLDVSMRQYFSQRNSQFSFSIPFKKNSMEKTMNGNFLRRIFSCQRFAQDYSKFMIIFKDMMLQDNRKKIRYLAELIIQALAEGPISKIEKIKRLPWTKQILEQTNQLALNLAQNKGQGIGRR